MPSPLASFAPASPPVPRSWCPLAQIHGTQPFLAHISTDQVYSGGSTLSKEWVDCTPVNVFGK